MTHPAGPGGDACERQAHELLAYCLRGERWPPELLASLLAQDCSEALFRIVAEGLSDRFEPALCETYADLFSQVIAHAVPGLSAADLACRYRRIRAVRRFTSDPHRVKGVFVLSRITLGADVAVTSVILNAAKSLFPEAEIYLAGSQKNWELFAGDARIRHQPAAYPRRGSLAERLSSWTGLKTLVSQPDTIVIDPDSRLTQLGLLPVCPEPSYFFFESRSYGGAGGGSLPGLTQRWVAETFGLEGARPYVAPLPVAIPAKRPRIAVSLGTGENPDKRVADPFEEQLLAFLMETGATVWIDRGAGGEEAERVQRATVGAFRLARSGAPLDRVRAWPGSFAGFAAIIAQSDLYIGYDSAGQHVAAACGVPLVSIFKGFPCARMFARWHPGPEVIRVDNPDPADVLRQTMLAVERQYSRTRRPSADEILSR